MARRITRILLVLILIVGVGIMLYPTASNWWNIRHQSRAIAQYDEEVNNRSEAENQAMLKAAQEYNESLLSLADQWVMSDERQEEYDSLLDVSQTGVMGYIEIPKIDISLPIYHSVEDSVLQVAVGHLPESSLPVGGESTHCVLSGHRGLPSARLFTDLDQLEEGDLFILNILGEKLAYRVDQIKTVLPEEKDDLAIVEGKDYCTLMTCTPYGVNSHRLLVRGERTAYVEEEAAEQKNTAAGSRDQRYLLIAGGAVLLLLLVIFIISRRISRRKKHR